MLISIQSGKIYVDKKMLTYLGERVSCWFTGYFFYQSKYYFSRDACILFEQILIEDRLSNLKEFNGIFECVLIDEGKKRIFLVNDRFGFNQLFYCYTEKSAIICDDFWIATRQSGNTELNKTSLLELLQYRFVSGKYTLVQNVFCLEPSSILEISYNQNIKINREEYWHFQYKPQQLSLKEAEEKIYNCLNNIISRFNIHLFNEKTIGINLTGGLDSRYVVSLLLNNGMARERIKAFTYGSEESEDIRFSTLATSEFGIEHTPILFKDDFEDFFDKNHIDNMLNEIGFYSYFFPAYGVNRVLPYYKNIDYLLSGYDGFYAGLKTTPELFNLKNKQELLNYIYSLNATILSNDQCQSLLSNPEPELRNILINRIEENINPSYDQVSSFFNWTIKNRNRKYLLGVYKMQNRNTCHLLTFYDYDFIDLMYSLPFEALESQKTYINSMFRKAFTGRFEQLAKIPAEGRGIFIKAKDNYIAPRKKKYTFRKLIKKIFNSYDWDYNYPIRQQLGKKHVFKGIIEMIDSSKSEFLDKNKVISYIIKSRKSEYFARYGLLVLLSIIRFENLLKKDKP